MIFAGELNEYTSVGLHEQQMLVLILYSKPLFLGESTSGGMRREGLKFKGKRKVNQTSRRKANRMANKGEDMNKA